MKPSILLASIALVLPAVPAAAQQSYLQPPAQPGEAARCDYLARLHRFAEESKSMCDEGRQVQPGPVTRQILQTCRAEQGKGFDRLPIDDLINGFSRQVDQQGLGNACHAIKVQVWDLIQQ